MGESVFLFFVLFFLHLSNKSHACALRTQFPSLACLSPFQPSSVSPPASALEFASTGRLLQLYNSIQVSLLSARGKTHGLSFVSDPHRSLSPLYIAGTSLGLPSTLQPLVRSMTQRHASFIQHAALCHPCSQSTSLSIPLRFLSLHVCVCVRPVNIYIDVLL